MIKLKLDKDGKQIPTVYTFEGLESCTHSLLQDIIERKRKELTKAKAEKYRLIGMVLFYQTAIANELGKAND